MPTWVLALNYWLHLLATILWIGGLAALILVAWPGILAAQLPDEPTRTLQNTIEKRFRPIANLSLVVLAVTGMLQMNGDSHYEGLLQIANPWSVGMLIKHLAYLGMVALTAVLQLFILPELGRARLLAHQGGDSAEEQRLLTRLRRFSLLELILGVLVLACTAYVTAL